MYICCQKKNIRNCYIAMAEQNHLLLHELKHRSMFSVITLLKNVYKTDKLNININIENEISIDYLKISC